MKKILFSILSFLIIFSGNASHIIGGELNYDYVSASENFVTYKITLMLVHDDDCKVCASLNNEVYLGIYDNDNKYSATSFNLYKSYEVLLNEKETMPITATPKCMTNKPSASYSAGYYHQIVRLPKNTKGYTVAFQTCCRVNQILNLDYNKGPIGATYYTLIPGKTDEGADLNDNCPRFSKDISIICHNSPFTFNFSATDADGDDLVYEFCPATNGGLTYTSENVVPTSPPYQSVLYDNSYVSKFPLGLKATINSKTGIIEGIAPESGKYLVGVRVKSYRKGNLVSEHYKDFIITVADCDYASASLLSEYQICNGLTGTFNNLNTSPLNETFYWDFGDVASGKDNISESENPTHTFTKPGTYKIKLIVNKDLSCPDTSIAIVKISPTFKTNFTYNGKLQNNEKIMFLDKSISQNGKVVKWLWSIDSQHTTIFKSSLQNPNFTFEKEGEYQVRLSAENSFGCSDSVQKSILISSKPSVKESPTVSTVYFINNSFFIRKKYKKALISLVDYLKQHEEISVQINGYTNNLGSETSNDLLSYKRARAISSFLITKGVASNRINIDGLGEKNPKEDNNTSLGKILNRRAEIQLLPQK